MSPKYVTLTLYEWDKLKILTLGSLVGEVHQPCQVEVGGPGQVLEEHPELPSEAVGAASSPAVAGYDEDHLVTEVHWILHP